MYLIREYEENGLGISRGASIEILAPAKLNLLLNIVGVREDGYHELFSIFTPVSLYDILKIAKIESGVKIYWRGRKLQDKQDNLIYRAALCFFEKTGINNGVRITVDKKIPISSGLGGGSSDAAATLKALNRLWGNPLSKKGLEKLALSLGADVPFFLLQRPAIVRGIGEILEPIDNFPDIWYAIVSPRLMVSTEWAYKNTKLDLTKIKNQDIMTDFRKEVFKNPDMLSNDLEAATFERYPFLGSIKTSLLKLGAFSALMTGSGPSVFGLFRTSEEAFKASKIFELRKDSDVFVVEGLH